MTTTTETLSWQETAEWKEILERHKKVKDKGQTEILELIPVHEKVFGGMAIMGEVHDGYGNLVANTNNPKDRMGVGPFGAFFDYGNQNDLKYIYQILHCPIYKARLVYGKEAKFRRIQHQFRVIDEQVQSEQYATNMREDVEYKNTIYTYDEPVVNFLCSIAGVSSDRNIGVKKADLCTAWDMGRRGGKDSPADVIRNKIKNMMDSPDMDYFKVTYEALSQGNVANQIGFYKTPNGIYKYNEEILGNSIEHVVTYLKTHDEVYASFRRVDSKTKAKPKL